MTLQIEPVESDPDRRRFLELPYRLYKDDPTWIPPLRLQMREQLDPKRNPFLRHARARLFLAKKDGSTVGRISAHYEPRHDSDTAMFGFFDCVDDEETAKRLVEAAASWVRDEGRTRMQGPYCWTSHEPLGVLVKGFDTPPMLLMNHNPEYYDRLLKAAGLKKKKDLFAYKFTVGGMPQEVIDEYEATKSQDRLVFRKVDLKKFEEELAVIVSIYNEAWKNNWGFSPITKSELRATAKGLKPIADPDYILIAELDGEPAGMAVAVPNVNEAIADLDGRLLPLGWARLLWRLKVRRTKTARLMLVGILPKHRGPWSRAILTGLYGRLHDAGKRKGLEWGELSWTLEDNQAINRSIERTGSVHYKTYRIYETPV